MFIQQDLWSGRQFVNLIVQEIYLAKKNNQFDYIHEDKKYEEKVIIENGEYKHGIMDKGILGNKSQGIVHVIYNDLGAHKAQEFLDDMQNIVTNWLITQAFSVGISDLMANDQANRSMESLVAKKENGCRSYSTCSSRNFEK